MSLRSSPFSAGLSSDLVGAIIPPVMALKNASCYARIASNPGMEVIGFMLVIFSIALDCPSRSISKLACKN